MLTKQHTRTLTAYWYDLDAQEPVETIEPEHLAACGYVPQAAYAECKAALDRENACADEDEPPDSITQTCAAWVAENGRGFLCTTEQ